MKKLKLNLQQFEGAEVLTRSQLKQILGGDFDGGSGAPGWKCCWTGTTNCSSCVIGGTSCVKGATLTAC